MLTEQSEFCTGPLLSPPSEEELRPPPWGPPLGHKACRPLADSLT